jgi:DNA-binding IclR family transcriptional regulator
LDLSLLATTRVASIKMVDQSHGRAEHRAPSPARALAVLDLLADVGHPMHSMAIALECGIPRSSAYRLLALMRSRDYVAQDGADRSWTLGPRLLVIAGGVPTLHQALRVLEAFDTATPRLTVADLAIRAGHDIRLTGQLVDTLVSEGFLSHDLDGQLLLGPRLVALAARAEPIEHVVRTARPHLEHLRDRTGETANLLMRDGMSAVYLDQAESPRALRVSGWLGRRIPLGASASGAALTRGGLHVMSGVVEPGVIAVACRIQGLRSIDAAVSVTAPAVRLRSARLDRAKAEVEATAAAITEALAGPARRPQGAARPHGTEGGAEHRDETGASDRIDRGPNVKAR